MRYSLEYLRDVTARIFVARGTPREDAELVAGLLVQASARGLHSHGILRVPQYVRNIEEGQIRRVPKTVEHLQIGAVDATGHDTNQHPAGSDLRIRDLFDDQGLAECTEQCSLHGITPSVSRGQLVRIGAGA